MPPYLAIRGLLGNFSAATPPTATAISKSSTDCQEQYPASHNQFCLSKLSTAGDAGSVSGSPPLVPVVVDVNERTTVATANAFAQFVNGSMIEGNTVGMSNALPMAGNLANPITGNVAIVLSATANGGETSTFATFNSLTNVVASCLASASNCAQLFKITTPAGGPAPTNVLQALVNVVKYPSYLDSMGDRASDDPLFDLSQKRQIYTPFLTSLDLATDQLALVPQDQREAFTERRTNST